MKKLSLLSVKPIGWMAAIIGLIVALSGATSFANDWRKTFGKQKSRRSGQRHTTVAAVRGVDVNEPSQVDPEARNYEAIAKMETRAVSSDKVGKFASDGKLTRIKIQTSGSAQNKEAK